MIWSSSSTHLRLPGGDLKAGQAALLQLLGNQRPHVHRHAHGVIAARRVSIALRHAGPAAAAPAAALLLQVQFWLIFSAALLLLAGWRQRQVGWHSSCRRALQAANLLHNLAAEPLSCV